MKGFDWVGVAFYTLIGVGGAWLFGISPWMGGGGCFLLGATLALTVEK
jgi:hypothetical protein